jgi:2-methylisocitrate lyase-like PEP mutase family enzyme
MLVGLRRKLQAGELFLATGMQGVITTVIACGLGFEAVYASGDWITRSAKGCRTRRSSATRWFSSALVPLRG